VSRDVLSKLLGHSDESTARHYYEIRDDRAMSAARTIKLRKTESKAR
jgi:integrase